jgi:hypothetical protein
MAFGFLRGLFSFFDKKDDHSRRLLKKLTRDLQGSRFARFYKARSMEVQPALGKFFYDLYKNLSHAQVFLQNAARSAQLKQSTVEAFLDMKFLDARQRLNADYVAERAKTMPITEVSRLLREDLAILASAFDGDFIHKVDRCYNHMLSLIHLAGFDYYVFLRRFDPGLPERDFNRVPHFKPVPGALLVEQLKDFLDVAYPIETEMDWSMPLRILKTFKNGLDTVKEEEWASVLSHLRELWRASILELMIRHISMNPHWELKARFPQEHIAAAYLEDRRQEVDSAFSGFLYSQKQNQVTALARELFGDPDIRRLQYYTEKDNESFARLGLKGFAYPQVLNYLKAFLVEFFQQDIQNVCELLLVRGHWSSMDQSREMSETYHLLLDNTSRLFALEQSLGENGTEGPKLRSALLKSGKNQSQLKHLNAILQRINNEAWDLLSGTAESLVLLGRQFKDILMDVKAKEGNYITNYRELQRESEPPLTQRLITIYKRIYTYLQIQQLLTGVDNTSPDPLTA